MSLTTTAAPHDRFLAQRRFGALDGLRALGVLAVIWHHTSPSIIPQRFVNLGAHGVTLFFAVSGFLITSLLLREHEESGRIDLRAFFVRRVLRIFPLYYGVLLIYVGVVLIVEPTSEPGTTFFRNLPAYLSYTSNIFVPPSEGRVIFYFAWSLATEEQFYLAWPPLLALARVRHRALLLLLCLLGIAAYGSLTEHRVLSLVPVSLVAGALLAVVLRSARGYALLSALLGARVVAPLLLVALFLAAVPAGVPDLIVHVLVSLLVGACVIREDHGLRALLSARWLAYIGTISYGMYLLHMLCKNIAVRGLGAAGVAHDSVPVFLVTTALATAAATLSFRYYESFFLRLKERYRR